MWNSYVNIILGFIINKKYNEGWQLPIVYKVFLKEIKSICVFIKHTFHMAVKIRQ